MVFVYFITHLISILCNSLITFQNIHLHLNFSPGAVALAKSIGERLNEISQTIAVAVDR